MSPAAPARRAPSCARRLPRTSVDAYAGRFVSQRSTPCAGGAAAGETRLQQIAAGRRLPVEHLAGAEHAGQRRAASGRSSSASKRTPPAVLIASATGRGAARRSGSALSAAASRAGSAQHVARQQLVQQRRLHAAQAEAALQVRRQAARAARARHLGLHARGVVTRQQVELRPSRPRRLRSRRAAAPTRHRPGCLRCRSRSARIRRGRSERVAERQRHRLDRRAGEALAQMRAPAAGHLEAAVGRAQRRDVDARRPAAAAPTRRRSRAAASSRRRAPARSRRRRPRAARRPAPSKLQAAVGAPSPASGAARGTPRRPRAAGAARRAAAARPSCRSGTPGPSCRRRSRRRARAAHARSAARVERVEPARDLGCTGAVTRGERRRRLAVRQVQPAACRRAGTCGRPTASRRTPRRAGLPRRVPRPPSAPRDRRRPPRSSMCSTLPCSYHAVAVSPGNSLQCLAQLGPDLGPGGERIGRVARLHHVLEPRLHAAERLAGGCRCRSGARASRRRRAARRRRR